MADVESRVPQARPNGHTAKAWREAVRRSDAPVGVKCLCDYLSGEMWQQRGRHNGIQRWVSVPEPFICEALGKPPRTIRRWVHQAVESGVLTVVRRGGNGRAAEYQGLMPNAATRPGYTESNTSLLTGWVPLLTGNFSADRRNGPKLGATFGALISTDHTTQPQELRSYPGEPGSGTPTNQPATASGCSPGTNEGPPRPGAGASSRPGQGGEPAEPLRVPIPAQDSQDDSSAQPTTTGHNPDKPGSGTPDSQPTDQTRGLAMTEQRRMREWFDSLADEPDSVAEHFDTAGQDQGSRGHLTGVPLPDRSRQATGFTRPLVRVTRIPGSNAVRITPVRSAA